MSLFGCQVREHTQIKKCTTLTKQKPSISNIHKCIDSGYVKLALWTVWKESVDLCSVHNHSNMPDCL
jgi:hypothetical protein